jgi:hypothetical protein
MNSSIYIISLILIFCLNSSLALKRGIKSISINGHSPASLDMSNQLVNTELLVKAIESTYNDGHSGSDTSSSALSPKTVSILMQTLLPSMFSLFKNITDADFKEQFQEPCKFDQLLDMFAQLPPYFDKIGQLYPGKTDLITYYSMQMSSGFLVKNGSLTMTCLYNMLSLQSRLNNFSMSIMDKPEHHPHLVGLFGIFMKPLMGQLKKNEMMKIIEYVEKYDKNDDRSTITIFHIMNVVFCLMGVFGILSNILLIVLLKKTSDVKRPPQMPREVGRLISHSSSLSQKRKKNDKKDILNDKNGCGSSSRSSTASSSGKNKHKKGSNINQNSKRPIETTNNATLKKSRTGTLEKVNKQLFFCFIFNQ